MFRGAAHLVQQIAQLLLELGEVARGDQALLGLVEAVAAQLGQLVLDEAQHTVGQREAAVTDHLQEALLHLGRGLEEEGRRRRGRGGCTSLAGTCLCRDSVQRVTLSSRLCN